MSKYLLLHPDDVGRVKPVDSIAIARDMFGVTKPGEGFLVNMPETPPFMPICFPVVEEPADYPMSFRYMGLATSKPSKFPGLDFDRIIFDEMAGYLSTKRAYRKSWSLKRRAREQRRLDWESRARRRKRRKELQRRQRG